jgi:hypothetical protein
MKKGAARNIAFALLAISIGTLSTTYARADIAIDTGTFGCGTCNITFDPQPDALSLTGTNQNGLTVVYTGLETLHAITGQAAIEAVVGTFTQLSWDASSNYIAETFSILNDGAGTVTIIVNQGLSNETTQAFVVDGNGEDKFTIFATNGQTIDTVLITSSTGFESFRQDRIATELSQIPLPPALVLFGSALVGMAMLGRRRKKTV